MASDAEQQRSDRILGFLVSKGLHGCPVCSQGRFSVGPEHVIISTPDAGTMEGAPVESSAVVPVMCGRCGHTMLFGTRMLPNQGEEFLALEGTPPARGSVGLCLSSSCPRNAANVREFLTYGIGKPSCPQFREQRTSV